MTKSNSTKPTSPTRPTRPTQPTPPTSPRSRRRLSTLLYGPGAVQLRVKTGADVEDSALEQSLEVTQEEQDVESLADKTEQTIDNTGGESAESVSDQEIVESPATAQPGSPNPDQRANRIVSSLLSKEKQNLPEWMAELLAPMDEPAQLAFLLKYRAEINASRRGHVGVPASPSAEPAGRDAERAVFNHRRVYDTF